MPRDIGIGTRGAADAGPRGPGRDLLNAAYHGNMQGVRDALGRGAPVDAADPATGLTALHIAAGTSNLKLAMFLVEECMASFGPDGFGRWPSAVAAECEATNRTLDYICEKEAESLGRDQQLTN